MGNQPEPKLIASSVSQNAASSSRVPGRHVGLGVGRGGGKIDRDRPDVRGSVIGVDAHEWRLCVLAQPDRVGEDVGHGLGSYDGGAGNDPAPATVEIRPMADTASELETSSPA